MNYEKLKIGTFLLKDQKEVSEDFENSSWTKTILVSPGIYDVYVYLTFLDFKEHSLGHSFYIPVKGPVIKADFGSSGLNGYKLGKEDKGIIKIPTFCMHDYIAAGLLEINKDIILSFEYSSAEDKKYIFYKLRKNNG